MRDGWRGRVVGLAIIVLLAALASAVGAAAANRTPAETRLIVRGPGGELLVEQRVEPGDMVVLRYRNSLYGSLAEERYVVTDDMRLELERLAADQLAVLEEYYAIAEPATRAGPRDAREWIAEPAMPVVLTDLDIAATDLGERTLLIGDGDAIALWRLVDDVAPTVTLGIERGAT